MPYAVPYAVPVALDAKPRIEAGRSLNEKQAVGDQTAWAELRDARRHTRRRIEVTAKTERCD